MSPGVLLSSGYIAGGAIAGVLVAFFGFLPDKLLAISQSDVEPAARLGRRATGRRWPLLAY